MLKQLAVAALLLWSQTGLAQSPRLDASAASRPTGTRFSTEPDQSSFDLRRLDAIDTLVQEAIADKKLPGAVIVIGRGDRVLYQRAFGNRALVPSSRR